MLILYTKPNCKDCEKVKDAFLQTRSQYEDRDISDEENLKELIDSEMSDQVPVLVDTFTNTSMSDLDEIVDYIMEYAF